jgi:tRNA threonylcarbamoyladenosine biosynthesis protein TsaB
VSRILNIETSTNICSVSISENGNLTSYAETDESDSHSRLLTILIDKNLNESGIKIQEIDAVAVSKGPGSYTGLRIGISTAKGICFGLSKPLIAIDTLLSLAINISENSDSKKLAGDKKLLYCPMIDARRMEVYSAFYDKNFNKIREIQADIIDLDSYSDILSENIVLFGGTGSHKCKEIINNPNAVFIENIRASARYMSKLSHLSFENREFAETAYFEPFYLKEFIAGKPKKR